MKERLRITIGRQVYHRRPRGWTAHHGNDAGSLMARSMALHQLEAPLDSATSSRLKTWSGVTLTTSSASDFAAGAGDIGGLKKARKSQVSFTAQLLCGDCTMPGDVVALRRRRWGRRSPSGRSALKQIVEGIAASRKELPSVPEKHAEVVCRPHWKTRPVRQHENIKPLTAQELGIGQLLAVQEHCAERRTRKQAGQVLGQGGRARWRNVVPVNGDACNFGGLLPGRRNRLSGRPADVRGNHGKRAADQRKVEERPRLPASP